jgi:hypothetical protein
MLCSGEMMLYAGFATLANSWIPWYSSSLFSLCAGLSDPSLDDVVQAVPWSDLERSFPLLYGSERSLNVALPPMERVLRSRLVPSAQSVLDPFEAGQITINQNQNQTGNDTGIDLGDLDLIQFAPAMMFQFEFRDIYETFFAFRSNNEE